MTKLGGTRWVKAAEATGLAEVPLGDRTALLSDNRPRYLSHLFGHYLRLMGIQYIVASPYLWGLKIHPARSGSLPLVFMM